MDIVYLPGGNIDERCSWCFNWCTEHASCGMRYFHFHGEWLDQPNNHLNDEDKITMIPICDRCVEIYGYDDGIACNTRITVGDRVFVTDCMLRVND